MSRLNPGQYRLFQRHVDRAIETLEEADRLLKGLVDGPVARSIEFLREQAAKVDHDEVATVTFQLEDLPPELVPYLDNPFAQSLAFNMFCAKRKLSHTQGQKEWQGGATATSVRNLVFLPHSYAALWKEGQLDKTRLVAIANRNLKDSAYEDIAELVRTRHKEDVDERLLKIPASDLRVGRRGPEQALEAAAANGWINELDQVEIAEDLVDEAGGTSEAKAELPAPVQEAVRMLRAGLEGAHISDEIAEILGRSPAPVTLAEKFLTAHKQSGDPNPEELTKTMLFAHAGPMQRIVADDKLLLRHFRPIKTQKRGQLFYKLLEISEEAILEKAHLAKREDRGITDVEAMDVVREVIADLQKDPNRYLEIPEDWLGEVTRRHLYFGSRTRKEGAAYKWFRRLDGKYYLGSHKTDDEVAEREARREARAKERAAAKA